MASFPSFFGGSLLDRRYQIATYFIVLLYVLSGIGFYYPQYLPITGLLITPDITRELGVVELLEVIMWFTALLMFVKLAFTKDSRAYSARFRFWCFCFALLCFLAVGEESSWGQHLGVIDPPESITSINAQQEFNFHNLNVGTLLNLDESHFLFPYLNSKAGVAAFINPIFYAFCGFVWVFIPFLYRRGLLNGFWLTDGFPIASQPTSKFVLFNLITYLIVDKNFFDVAECLEVAMPCAAVFVALDVQGNRSQ